MKVLIVTPDPSNPGGIANYYRVLRPYLRDNIAYFTAGPRKGEDSVFKKSLRLLRDYYGFFLEIRTHKYDIIHVNPSLFPHAVIRDGIFLLLANTFCNRTIAFVRGWDVNCERFIRKYFLRIFRYAYFKADVFVVLSSEFAAVLKELGYSKRIFCETTVVDDQSLEAGAIRCHSEKDRKGLLGNDILFLARLEREKGVYIALEAFRILRNHNPNVSMTFAGSGNELEHLRRCVHRQEIPGVRFTGYVRGYEKMEIFSRAKIFFFPTSYGEGMPNSVLEAMAYGLPVVTRPVGGLKDFFENGRMGYISESLCPSEFARYLDKLLEDDALRARIGTYNQRYATERFAASHVAQRLTTIYRDALGA